MRKLLLLALSGFCSSPLLSGEDAGGFQATFERAESLEKADPDGAIAAYLECVKSAAAEGNQNYANAAGLSACWVYYRQGKVAATGKLAAEVLGVLAALPPERVQIFRRVQFFGFMERGFLVEGRLGEAMRANRAAAETLRGKHLPATADGRSLTVEEAIRLPSALRGFGWRVLEREAQLLELTGNVLEGMELLDRAAEFFGADWTRKLPGGEHFYAFKLLAARAEMKDFLGYKEEAIKLQEELAVSAGLASGDLRPGVANLRFNRLRNLSLWEGPSEEILGQAREVAAELKRLGDTADAERLIALMEFDLKETRDSAAKLGARAVRNRLLGDEMAAATAERDELAVLTRIGEGGLDERYFALLAKARRQGRKISEPTLYTNYASYLMRQDRLGEAIAMYSEALRLTRSFGMHLHEPALLGNLFHARLAAGDIAGVRSVLGELDAWIAKYPDAPAQRLALALGYRGQVLARLGDEKLSREAFALARKVGAGLPEYQIGYLSEASVDDFFAALRESAKPFAANDVAEAAAALSVEAAEVFSVAAPGEVSRVTFSVANPSSTALSGAFVISGPAPSVARPGETVRFSAGAAVMDLVVPGQVPAGGLLEIPLEMAPADAVGAASATVSWQTDGKELGTASKWNVSWDESATGRVVMDASAMDANPFRSIIFRHELTAPLGETVGIPFRLRSAVPLRIEYYEKAGGAIIAVDENGNGDFTETGDFHRFSPGGIPAALFPMLDVGGKVTAEIRVFAPDGKPLPMLDQPVVLAAEVLRDGAWVKEAENVIR